MASPITLDEREVKVKSWLHELFGDVPVPICDLDEHMIEVLEEMMERNRRQDDAARILIEEYKHKTQEYEARGQQLQKLLLDSVGFSTLSSTSLQTLVNSATVLDLQDTKDSSFMLAMNEQTKNIEGAHAALNESKVQVQHLLHLVSATCSREQQLARDLRMVEQEIKLKKGQLEKEQKQTEFLSDKTLNYKEQIADAEEQLTSRNMNPSLSHESLVSLSQELSKLKQDIVPLKAKLQSFQDLPPNLMLARVKVEEARRDLESLEKEVEIDFFQL
uniref:HAUS augmin-like complex subunit 1 n=1 Tax=Myxine glutinosa TaxID=7769 RepID=UPI00359022D3